MPDIKFSYKPVPTLRKFADSDAFMRLALGPFGCLSGDSEYLSPLGWKRMDEYDGGLVAQWHKDTNSIEFVRPTQYIDQPATELIEFRATHFVMKLSGEHRVPHYNYANKFKIKTAAEIVEHPSRTTIPTVFKGHSQDALGMSDDLIRFAVMMHADGHYPKRCKKAAVVVRKDRKKDRIRFILSTLGIEFTETTYKSRPTETAFRFYPPYIGKRYAGRWWRASQRELAVVLDECKYWDGYQGNKEQRYFSSYKEDADYIQYAAHANGLRASVNVVKYKHGRWRDSYNVNIRTGNNGRNVVMIRSDNETGTISKIPALNGRKYCFSVPTSFFIARCENSVFITGNSGKSSACVIETISRALAQKPSPDGIRRSRWIVVRNTYRQLNDSTIKTFFQWLPPIHFGDYKQSDQSYNIKGFEGAEIEIIFRALDRPDHVGNLLSLEVTGGWVNEAREVPWPIIEALQGRVGRYPAQREGGASWWGVFMDSNPADSDSKLYKYFVEGGHDPKEVALFKQPSGLSPLAENLDNLPGAREYYRKMAVGKDPEFVKVYIHGDWGFVSDGRQVFPEYIDAVHCAECKPVRYAPIYRGWDFGLTPACVFLQLLPTGQIIIFDEIVSESMSVDQFSDVVVEHTSQKYDDFELIDIGDPAGDQRAQTDARTCFQILHSKGILIEAGMQTMAVRLECVRKPLTRLTMGKPGLQLHPRCKTIRKGFMGGYCFRRLQTSAERYTAVPDKNAYSHCHDALQYPLTRIFGGGLTSPRYHDFQDTTLEEDVTRSDVTGY